MKYNILATAFSFLLVGLALFTPAGIAFAERLVPCDGPDCNLCQLAQLAENIVNFYVKIAFVAAALLFTVAGFMFFTGGADPTKITNAKKIFTNTFVGIIIILTSWLVVNVLLTTLMGEGVNPFTVRVFCAEVRTTSTPSTPGDDTSGDGAGITTDPVDLPLTGSGSGATSYELVEVPFNQYCRDVRGENWRGVDDRFCGDLTSGSTFSCCGFFPPTNGSVTTLTTQEFSPSDTESIQNYLSECNAQGGSVTNVCVSTGFDPDTMTEDDDDDVCLSLRYSCN